MIGFDGRRKASTHEQRLSFATYVVTGTGILATVMFLGAALYLTTIG